MRNNWFRGCKFFLAVIHAVAVLSCQKGVDKIPVSIKAKSKAQEVVDLSIKAHGGKLFDKILVRFTFRERQYTAFRNDGFFTYTRAFRDSSGHVKDVLQNNGFYREVNGKRIDLSEDKKLAYSNSVNSVIYFALLPYGLNDASVHKQYLGQFMLKNIPFHKIKVTFNPEGGGIDFDDEFVYWIHPQTYKVHYLAYSYKVNGGGLRFREAFNDREINGVVFQDYINFEPLSDTASLEHLDKAFLTESLKKLSDIHLENILVTINK
ncbi:MULTISPECIES: DUF6503 family protein [Hymenobacter]|uniref:DUF6503 family protein n=1 Tax=Hymenobacter TaxID=89966 RepID=UPI0010586952|nr:MULTISPECIES: DUF6503 family protein [Hymenobacter]QIL78177.1 hypothetical protein G7064_20320 [Hymenobacter sp. HDW8]